METERCNLPCASVSMSLFIAYRNSELSAHLFQDLDTQGLRRLGLGLGFCVRTVSSVAQRLQILQLEADINACCPALGFEAPSAFGRGRVPGFSIVPTALKPSGFGSGTTTSLGRLDATFLCREMSNSLTWKIGGDCASFR